MPWTSTNRISAKLTNSSAETGEIMSSPNHTIKVIPMDAAAETNGRYAMTRHGYGKSNVKLLHVHRNGAYHSIREFVVSTELKLHTQKDYVIGDNKDIIATDSQKNTIYLLAKKHGVKTPEEFGTLVVNHFLYTYKQLNEARCNVTEYPWERLQAEKPHNHAFIYNATASRWCEVYQRRNESVVIKSGLSGLRVLKTTQSAFVDYVQDEYTTLAESAERIFSTVVEAEWEYLTANNIDFDLAWLTVKEAILDKFAGPPDTGIFSPSVQNTLYLAEKDILDRVPHISWIKMTMPNKHYLNVDLTKFPENVTKGDPNHYIYHPIDSPAGLIYAQLCRRSKSHL